MLFHFTAYYFEFR